MKCKYSEISQNFFFFLNDLLNLRHCFNLILYFRFKASPEDQLQKAFEVLDMDKKGHLTVEELTKYMTEEGRNQSRMKIT